MGQLDAAASSRPPLARGSKSVHREPINIAFGVDGDFVPHVAAAIASLVRNAPGARFRFLILYDTMPDHLRAPVEAVAPGARFDWISIGDSNIPPLVRKKHFSRAILFRLGLPSLAPSDCERVLYLDADIIVIGDVRELWNIDLEGAPLGAVVDGFVDAQAFAIEHDLAPPTSGYFNSGVLLLDLASLRESDLFAKAIDFAACHGPDSHFPDQDALNFVVWNKWRALPPRWNAQHDMVVPWLAPQLPKPVQFHNRLPALVHFTGPEKPWLAGAYHPWAWLYWINIARTPFAKEVASKAGVSPIRRFRLWLRWMRKRPSDLWKRHPLHAA